MLLCELEQSINCFLNLIFIQFNFFNCLIFFLFENNISLLNIFGMRQIILEWFFLYQTYLLFRNFLLNWLSFCFFTHRDILLKQYYSIIYILEFYYIISNYLIWYVLDFLQFNYAYKFNHNSYFIIFK